VKAPKVYLRDTGLLLLKGTRRIGVEFKWADAPRLTPSMRIAQPDLGLDALYVVHPGAQRYPLAEEIETVPLWAVLPERQEKRRA
jgi:uncharacterized protein